MRRSLLSRVVLIAAFLLVAGCGEDALAPQPDISGHWESSWQSGAEPWHMTLTAVRDENLPADGWEKRFTVTASAGRVGDPASLRAMAGYLETFRDGRIYGLTEYWGFNGFAVSKSEMRGTLTSSFGPAGTVDIVLRRIP